MKLRRYYIVGDKLLCFIPRTGSTSLLKVIEEKHYPHNKRLEGIAIQFTTPSIMDDGKRELVSMFRDPIQRFLSGCYQTDRTVEQGIEELKKERVDIHIRPQHLFLSEKRPTKLFKFPDQLNECAEYLGLPTPLPHYKKSEWKPTATKKQLAWLEEYYKDDIVIFNKL